MSFFDEIPWIQKIQNDIDEGRIRIEDNYEIDVTEWVAKWIALKWNTKEDEIDYRRRMKRVLKIIQGGKP